MVLTPVIKCKSVVTRRRSMAYYSDFDEGNVSYIPEAKNQKDVIQLPDEQLRIGAQSHNLGYTTER